MTIEKRAHQRTLGLPGLVVVGFLQVGSAAFFAPGLVAAHAPGVAPVALAGAGLLFLLVALALAEGAGAFPDAGSAPALARRAFNDFSSFLAGWSQLLAHACVIALAAGSAVAHLGYLWAPLRDSQTLATGAASAVVIAGAIAGILGRNPSQRLEGGAVAAGLLVALLALALGIVGWQPGAWVESRPPGIWQAASLLAQGTSLAIVAFPGTEGIAQMAVEARDPRRGLLLAIMLTIVGALGLSLVAVALYGAAGASWKPAPLVAIAATARAPALLGVIAAGGAAFLALATAAFLSTASRLAFSMAARHHLPPYFSAIHHRSGTPYPAIALAGGLAVALLACGPFVPDLSDLLAELFGFGALPAMVAGCAAVIALRWSEPDAPRPIKLPGNVVFRGKDVPLLPTAGTLLGGTLWIALIATHPRGAAVGTLWLVSGIVAYSLLRERREPIAEAAAPGGGGSHVLVPDKVKRVLVPTTGSEFSQEMVAVACRLAKREGATVRALYVYEVPPSLPVGALSHDQRIRAERILQQALQIGEGLSVNVELAFLQGRKAGPMIVEEADAARADIILMGLDPHRRLQERVGGAPAVGKTVEYVLKHAGCRVLLSRPPREAEPG